MTNALIAESFAHRLTLSRPGEAHPLSVQNAPPGARPFIHPWRTPDGKAELTQNQPAHHPWQHGLYVGLNGVNGVGFWTEGLMERNALTDGTFDPAPLAPPIVEGSSARWEVQTTWRAPDGSALLLETQRWRLQDTGSSTQLDLVWTLEAAVDLAFAQYAYGGLFLRMPWQAGSSAALLTSEGLTSPESADQKRARWAAVSMPLSDTTSADVQATISASVAFFDHPQNPEHPAPWRIDGELGMAPSRCIAGAWHLERGASTQSRYRLTSFCGSLDAAAIQALWSEYEAS